MVTVWQVIGLSLSQTLDDLALLYLATVQALAVSLMCFVFQMTSSEPQSDSVLGRKGCICFLVTLFLLCLLLWFQLGTLHILEAMKEAGHDIRTLFLCGGLSKNPLYVQIHANATGIKS